MPHFLNTSDFEDTFQFNVDLILFQIDKTLCYVFGRKQPKVV